MKQPVAEFTINWHVGPRGTLSKKMSGLELSTFVLNHMPFIVPLLRDMPTIQRAFQALFLRIATMDPSVLDEVHDWFLPICAGQPGPDGSKACDDDMIYLRPCLTAEEKRLAELEAERCKHGIWDTPETRARHADHLDKLECPIGLVVAHMEA